MNQTQTFKLNQWEKTDRIQMEDFNSDNFRLETALEAQQTTLTQLENDLKALTLKTGTRLWGRGDYVNPSDSIRDAEYVTDWSLMSELHVNFDPILASGATLTVSVNNTTLGTVTATDPAHLEDHRYQVHVVLFPLFSAERRVSVMTHGMDQDVIRTLDFTFAEMQYVNLYVPSKIILPGSHLRSYRVF